MEYPEGPGNTNIPFRVEETNNILEYENKIFEDYLEQRKLFINNIKNIDFNEFNNNEYLNFLFDTKMVIDPIKNASHNIKHFLKNKTKNFKNSESITFNKELQHIMILYYTFYKNTQPDSDSDSDSELELSSSNFLVNSSISSELTDSESFSESSESDDSSESSVSVSE